MPENFDDLFNNEKLVEDFVVYMEYESIEMKMNKHLALIHIPNWGKHKPTSRYIQKTFRF